MTTCPCVSSISLSVLLVQGKRSPNRAGGAESQLLQSVTCKFPSAEHSLARCGSINLVQLELAHDKRGLEPSEGLAVAVDTCIPPGAWEHSMHIWSGSSGYLLFCMHQGTENVIK